MKSVYTYLTLVFLFFTGITFSQIPRIINYQGLLLGLDKQPIPEGNYDLTFSIYDEPGNQLWTETHDQVLVSGGLFMVHLGAINPIDLPFDQTYFLGIKVGNESELEPRMMLTSSAYSLKSANTEALEGYGVSKAPTPNTILPLDSAGMFPSSVIPSSNINSNLYLRKNLPDTTKGNVASDMLHIVNNGTGRGMTVTSQSSHGIYAISHSEMAGVEGEGNGTGPGVRGSSLNHHGSIGYTDASDRAGIYGNSNEGIGVWGNSQQNSGVYGHSADNYGVYGHSTSQNEWVPAVYGKNQGEGDGVYGWSQNRNGVYGITQSPDPNEAGIYGANHGGGPAILSDGDMVVNGTLDGKGGVYGRGSGTAPAVMADGDLLTTGAVKGYIGPNGGGPFPRPAFDSGWIEAKKGADFTLGVGLYLPASQYNNNNFVVDLQMKGVLNDEHIIRPWITSAGVWGSNVYGQPHEGAYYEIKSNNDITIRVLPDAEIVDQVRLRVWYIK